MSAAALLASGSALAATGAVADEFKWMTFAVFGVIIAITMAITYWAARTTHTTSEFYAAGRSVSGIQNGWAIAGDYLSAASFLGIAGLISLYGYDGFMYSVGWLVAYITVLLVIAEPCRNIGKYTMGDILAFRNDPKKTKTVAALSTITVSTFYLTAQMVGGGVLIKTLIGIDYEISVIGVGILMLAYVVFGGMKATTWVQIIKAVLLVIASILLVMLVWAPYGFSLPGYLQAVVGDAKVQAQVAKLLGDAAANMTPEELGQRFLEPGLFLKSPIDQISLGMALVLGTAGMPHILMRFFTVPTAQAARISVIWAMGIIGGFYVLTLFLGTGAAMLVGPAKIAVDRPRRQHGRPAAGAIPGRRRRLHARQLVPRLRRGRGLRHHRRGGGRAGAGSGFRHGARHLCRRDQGRPCHAAGAGDGRARVLGDRRHHGDHRRHPGQGPERRSPGGAGFRRGGFLQPAGGVPHAVLEEVQHQRRRRWACWSARSPPSALVMISPNMTYPKAVIERRQQGAGRRAGQPKPNRPRLQRRLHVRTVRRTAARRPKPAKPCR